MDITISGTDVSGKVYTIGAITFDLAPLVGQNNGHISVELVLPKKNIIVKESSLSFTASILKSSDQSKLIS